MSKLDAKGLPFNHEAEMVVIGSCLNEELSPGCCEIAIKLTKPQYFTNQYRAIYNCIVKLWEQGVTPNEFGVLQEMLKGSEWNQNRSSIIDWLNECNQRRIGLTSLPYYCGKVKISYTLRQLLRTSSKIEAMAIDREDPKEILDFAEKAIGELASSSSDEAIKHIGVPMQSYLEDLSERQGKGDKLVGITSGLQDLDFITKGWRKDRLYVIGARPSIGKTTIGLNFALAAAKELTPKGQYVFIKSYEMEAQELIESILAAEAQVDNQRLATGFVTADEWDRLAKAFLTLERLNIYIDDSPGQNIRELKQSIKSFHRSHPVGWALIDFMQRMPLTSERIDPRRGLIEISGGFADLAKEIHSPIVALSQLSRECDKRIDDKGGHRPHISDLKESGSIEQDAAVVLLLYRDDAYFPERNVNSAELIIGKNRFGKIGTIHLMFQKAYSRFVSGFNPTSE